jgi:hypothetical protein
VTIKSKEENALDICPNYVQEFGLGPGWLQKFSSRGVFSAWWWSETAKRGKFLITLRLLRRESERKNWGKREIIK